MYSQRVVFSYLFFHVLVANLYFYDLLGEDNKGSMADKINSEVHLLVNFIICSVHNCNEFIFSVFFMAPLFLIGIAF